MKRQITILIACLLCCTSADELSTVKIQKDSRIRLKVEDVYPLSFTTDPADYKPKSIEWKSSNDSILQITDTNKEFCQIKFLKPGKAKITVTVDGKTATATFKVNRRFSYGILLMLQAVGLLAVAAYFIFKKRKDLPSPPDETEETAQPYEMAKYEHLKEKYSSLENEYKRMQSFNRDLLAERNDWERKYKELKRQMEKRPVVRESGDYDANYQNKPEPAEPITFTPDAFADVLYADAIIDGFFNRVKERPNEDTIFRMHLTNPHAAQFTVYSGAEQLVKKRPEFLEGCDKQVLNNAQNMRIESEGVAQQQADGKWKIMKRLNIIIN